jgi:hypothetical protein
MNPINPPETLKADPPGMPSIEGSGEPVKAKGKRGPYKKSGEPISGGLQPNREDLRPFLETLSLVLQSFHAEPLSITEIETGMNAWFPVWEKYAPAIGDKAVFMFPLVWTVSIAAPRILKGKKSNGDSEPEKS